MSEHTAFDPVSALHPVVQHHLANTLRWPGLRPLQAEAVQPVLSGADCLLLAPTAGGKTEAAALPLLTRMADENWQGTSVLYLCPLRALLNNLHPRLSSYAAWLGRSVALWHGDIGQSARARVLRDRPDILLTTPESVEAMLVSTKVDPRVLFDGLRAVVVDEVHAFAGDDRGWHLLALCERLSRIVGRPLERIGLSATVGNPHELISWLQGTEQSRPRHVVQPAAAPAAPDTEITLDYVGSVPNAAKVIASLHDGEKRLVFVDSRRRAEELGAALRALGVTTFLSHSSLSAAERRRSETAFAESSGTVIVATSTLELGVDVGDLDRVIQLDSPGTVASFLQRLGRTGRRAGTHRNCLFLCLEEESLLQAAGLLERWAAGWVEPITPPPSPRHIAAQQLLALCLQEHRLGMQTWPEWWGGLPLFDDHAAEIVNFLRAEGYFETDGDFLFLGPEAERRFGRRYFSDLTAVFSAPPEFTVLHGREEVGTIGDELLVEETDGPRVLLLAGRAWQVNHIDWARRRCWVEPSELSGRAKWSSGGGGLSFAVTRGMRTVLLGTDPDGVTLTHRAKKTLDDLRDTHADHVDPERLLLRETDSGELRWWTWAGSAVNRTLHASLPEIIDPRQRINDRSLRLLPDLTSSAISAALNEPTIRNPTVNAGAVSGLKFSAALPPELAADTLATRLGDQPHARHVITEPRRILRG
ncbi:DEAD/DEAH box helicase [Saccharomonospora iraqiensis]|uniref:DEAD/DEAH box helicase n=1 Tax=Saccharomonospora iraqiensis TaxID=52698 RepID=UPI0004294C6C|nr:DEAD/DEAH box helicase [Saccharomonospora iraqiensis]